MDFKEDDFKFVFNFSGSHSQRPKVSGANGVGANHRVSIHRRSSYWQTHQSHCAIWIVRTKADSSDHILRKYILSLPISVHI